jgi:hypothetical protein
MKSIKFLLVSLVLIFCRSALACFLPAPYPGEYYVFYAFDESKSQENGRSSEDANIAEWMRLIGNQAESADVRYVVYKYSLESVQTLLTDSADSNTFARYILQHNDKEIVDYLALAKECELARAKRADRWWYPTKKDLQFADLKTVLERALAYKGRRLRTRYLLQAVRAAYTMHDYDLCLNLWDRQISKMPASEAKNLCLGYIGGIRFRRGEYEKAIKCYSSGRDMDSFWWCAEHLTKNDSDLERIKILYRYQPNSPELAKMIQKICREAEENRNYRIFEKENRGYSTWEDSYAEKEYSINRKRYMTLRDFALKVVAEKRCNNPAMWQYAAAFLTFLDKNQDLASEYVNQAENLTGSPFIKEKIHFFKIIVDACKANVSDSNFEDNLLADLQWIDSKMRKNLAGFGDQYAEWKTFFNLSQYYPNDMLRKLTFSVVIPKYLKQNDYTKALLLAGAASERIRTLVNFKHIDDRWNMDYCTNIFEFLDTLPIENVIEYQNIIKHRGTNAMDSFLTARCYKNMNYLNEIIGTKYLREEKFDSAIVYLSNVSVQFEASMNIYSCFHLDPFSPVYAKRKLQDPVAHFKLNYARKMLDLQRKMESGKNARQRAQAMIDYAVALRRSFTERESWALTKYLIGSGQFYVSDCTEIPTYTPDWEKKLSAKVKSLFREAKSVSNYNTEILAQILIAQAVEEVNSVKVDYKNIAEKYQKSQIVKQFEAECDGFKRYLAKQ